MRNSRRYHGILGPAAKDRAAQALALAKEAHTLAKEHCMAGLERQVKAILDEIQQQK